MEQVQAALMNVRDINAPRFASLVMSCFPWHTDAIVLQDLKQVLSGDSYWERFIQTLDTYGKLSGIEIDDLDLRRCLGVANYRFPQAGYQMPYVDMSGIENMSASTLPRVVHFLALHRLLDVIHLVENQLTHEIPVPVHQRLPSLNRPTCEFWPQLEDIPAVLSRFKSSVTSIAGLQFVAGADTRSHPHGEPAISSIPQPSNSRVGVGEEGKTVLKIMLNIMLAVKHLDFLTKRTFPGDTIPDIPKRTSDFFETLQASPLDINQNRAVDDAQLVKDIPAAALRMPLHLAVLISPLLLLLPIELHRQSWPHENLLLVAKALGNQKPPLLQAIENLTWAHLFAVLKGKEMPYHALEAISNGVPWQELEGCDDAFRFFFKPDPQDPRVTSLTSIDAATTIDYAWPLVEIILPMIPDSKDQVMSDVRHTTEEPEIVQKSSKSPPIMTSHTLAGPSDTTLVPSSSDCPVQPPSLRSNPAPRNPPSPRVAAHQPSKRLSPPKPASLTSPRSSGRAMPRISESKKGPASVSEDDSPPPPVASIQKQPRTPTYDQATAHWISQVLKCKGNTLYQPVRAACSSSTFRLDYPVGVSGGIPTKLLKAGKRTGTHIYGSEDVRSLYKPMFHHLKDSQRFFKFADAIKKFYISGSPLHIADPAKSIFCVMTEADAESSATDLHNLFHRQHLVITDCSWKSMEFGWSSIFKLYGHRRFEVLDYSEPYSEQEEQRIRSVDVTKLNDYGTDGRIFGTLDIPTDKDPVHQAAYTSDLAAWNATRDSSTIFCHPSEPMPCRQFSTVAFKNASHFWKTDPDGRCVYIDVRTGGKWCIVARPHLDHLGPDGLPNYDEFAKLNLFLEGYKADEPCDDRWMLEAIYLPAGTRLVLRSNTPYVMYNIADTICHGGYFYNSHNIQDAVFAIYHGFVNGRQAWWVERERDLASRRYLQRLVAFYHDAFVQENKVVDRSHLPQLDTFESLIELLTLLNVSILANVLDPRSYQYPGQSQDENPNERALARLEKYDFNDVPVEDRARYVRTRQLVYEILDWLCGKYVVRRIETDKRVDLKTEIWAPYLVQQAFGLVVYKTNAENQAVKGDPYCTVQSLETQVERCIQGTPLLAQAACEIDMKDITSFAFPHLNEYLVREHKPTHTLVFGSDTDSDSDFGMDTSSAKDSWLTIADRWFLDGASHMYTITEEDLQEFLQWLDSDQDDVVEGQPPRKRQRVG